jgi:hypothetical protein
MSDLILIMWILATLPTPATGVPPAADYHGDLWAMTATHYQWPTPPAQEPTPDARAPAPPATLPAAESQQLRRALDRMLPRLTGRLAWDSDAGLYVPEVKPEDAAPYCLVNSWDAGAWACSWP